MRHQHEPQTSRPSAQSVPAAASGPHVSLQIASAAQVAEQFPAHLMSQLEPPSQLTVLLDPRSNLQIAPFLHVACEPAPALSSHFEEALHITLLASPPFPLHSADCAQSMLTDPVDVASHLVAVAQFSEQLADPQAALQSRPLAHEQSP